MTIGSNSNGHYFDTSLNTNGSLYSAASGVVTSTSAGTTGTVMIGTTSSPPSFSATPSATSITLSAGTALSKYVEGTFTPGLSFGGGTTGITYNNQTGKYSIIGNICNINGTIGITSKGSSTGVVKITGLPFNGIGVIQFVQLHQGGGFTFPATYTDFAFTPDNAASTATVFAFATTAASILTQPSDTNFANATVLYFSGFYFIS